MLTDPVEYETSLNSLSLNGCPYCEGDTLFRQLEFAVVFSCCRERQYSTPTECDHLLILYKPTLFNVLPHTLNGIRTRARKVEKCSKNTFGTFHRWTGSLVAVDRIMTGYVGCRLAQWVEEASHVQRLGYERVVLEWFSHSQARMEWGSTPCSAHDCTKDVVTSRAVVCSLDPVFILV